MTTNKEIDPDFIGDGVEAQREETIGQHIGYRYDVNLVPDYSRLTPFLEKYIAYMGWKDLNWLEDVHMGYEEDRPAVFDATSTAGSSCRKMRNCRTTSMIAI